MKLNFCVFNHRPRTGIVDHLWFIKALCTYEKIDLEISDDLRPDALNILQENFTDNSVEVVQTFCQRWRKRVAIVLTEHLEVKEGAVHFNFGPLNNGGPPGNKSERFWSLCLLADHIFTFFTFGELPDLEAARVVFPASNMCALPYPHIYVASRQRTPEYDIVFTGQIAAYRRKILTALSRRYRVIAVDISHTSEDDREKVHAQAKVAINIPQNEKWRLGSPMRTLYSLRQGLPMVQYGEADETLISREVARGTSLEEAIEDPIGVWRHQMDKYERMIVSPLNPRFPRGLFEIWREVEGATLEALA